MAADFQSIGIIPVRRKQRYIVAAATPRDQYTSARAISATGGRKAGIPQGRRVWSWGARGGIWIGGAGGPVADGKEVNERGVGGGAVPGEEGGGLPEGVLGGEVRLGLGWKDGRGRGEMYPAVCMISQRGRGEVGA